MSSGSVLLALLSLGLPSLGLPSLGLLSLAPIARAHGPAEPAPPGQPSPAEQARKSVLLARSAFDRGDYTGAITHFEAARALVPSPKLLYNIGVCHMRLVRQAGERGDAQAEVRHAVLAIEGFNAYLGERPNADDRSEVEGFVRALGGSPVTQARLRDPLSPLPPTSDPPPDLPPNPPPEPPPGPAPDIKRAEPTPPPANISVTSGPPSAPAPSPQIPLPRGYLGLLLGVAVQPQLVPRDDLRGAAAGLLVLRGGARLGPRRRVELGARISFAVPTATPARPALSTTTLVLDAGYAVPLGRARRFELPVGGFLGFVHEALRVSPGQPRPTCAIEGTGTLVGARAGGVAGGRLGFAVLVGARRHHELGMHLTFAFHGFAPGPSSPACDATGSSAGSTASGRVLQDVPRARLMLTGALGYAFRF